MSQDRASLLTDPGFLSLWGIGTLASTARWLEMLVTGIFVFDVTASPFLVALMLVLRLLPMALFGLFGGALAARFDRYRVLEVALASMVVISGTLCLLAVTGHIAVWHVGLAAFLGGMVWSTDFPVRRTLLADIAGNDRVGSAMSLDIVSGSGTRMIGPLLGGALLAFVSLAGAFAFTLVAHGVALVLLLTVARRNAAPAVPSTEPPPGVLAGIVEGLRTLSGSPILKGIFIVTIVFNIWAYPFMSMVPVIGKDELHLGPFAVGLLTAAEGAGAFVGAIWLATRGQTRHYRQLYFYSVAVYLVLALVFSFSGTPVFATVALFAVGLSGAAFAALQSALVLLNTPESARRQMMGVLAVCIGSGPIGFLHLGVLSNETGAPTAILVIAIEGLVAMGLIAWRYPVLLTAQPRGTVE